MKCTCASAGRGVDSAPELALHASRANDYTNYLPNPERRMAPDGISLRRCGSSMPLTMSLFSRYSQSKLSQEQLAELQNSTHFDKKELQQWYKGLSHPSPPPRPARTRP